MRFHQSVNTLDRLDRLFFQINFISFGIILILWTCFIDAHKSFLIAADHIESVSFFQNSLPILPIIIVLNLIKHANRGTHMFFQCHAKCVFGLYFLITNMRFLLHIQVSY